MPTTLTPAEMKQFVTVQYGIVCDWCRKLDFISGQWKLS
jgi:hypothetical protein